MNQEIKLTRNDDKVVNANTGDVVGIIKDGGVTFVQNLDGVIYYDQELQNYISDLRNKKSHT